MPAHGMRAVGLFEQMALFVGKGDGDRRNGILQMLHPGGANDRRCDTRLAQQPGECDLRRRYPAALRHLDDAVDDIEVGVLVELARIRVGLRAASRPIFPAAGCQ